MNLTDRGKVYLIIALLSFLFSYLVTTLRFFPHFGMALFFITFVLYSFNKKKGREKSDKLYLAFSLIFSLFLFIRSEGMITFFNFWAAIFFGFLALLPKPKEKMTYLDHISSPILFTISAMFTKSDYYPELKEKKENFKIIKAEEVILGGLLTILLLVIVLPLLSTINPFFRKLVLDIWNFLSLSNLIDYLGTEKVFIWVVRLLFSLFFLFIIPKILTLINKSSDYSLNLPFIKSVLPLRIPKLILVIVLIVFFFTQIEFYLADDATLKNLGLSHSQYAREVFAQLTVVAGIVLLLIYNDNSKAKFNQILNWILGIQGIFLTMMAYKSDFDYINAWGLTYIRLYGLTFATWVTGIFALLFNNYRKSLPSVNFVKNTVIFSGAILLLVNILNYDYLIYNFKKAATGQGVDYGYLSNLSSDSLSYQDQYKKLEEMSREEDLSLEKYNNKNPLLLLYHIEHLQQKYSKFDLRTLSLLDYLQYRQIKSIDTSELRQNYENKYRYK